MRRVAIALLMVLACAPYATAAGTSHAEPVVTDVEFSVTNPLTPGERWTVRGTLYLPSADCTASVILMTHGLSYGRWAWDFPLRPDTYSTARALAAAGYASVAIDKLGYGDSDRPDGRTLTVQSYAAITDQIAEALRDGTYTGADVSFARVGLMGHSAGTEISTLAAGLYGSADALIATGYTHFPSDRIVTDFVTSEIPRALVSEYTYFGEDEAGRTEYMYATEHADEEVVALDHRLANLTPSGEILSISNQPSRWVMGLIDVPVLLVLAENDLLFPVGSAEDELALFLSSPDRTLHIVPDAGHTFVLHRNASETNAALADWLDAHDALPACGSA